MTFTHIAYIDEAGDEGFGKLRQLGSTGGQSRWLVIGAAVVEKQNDQNLPNLRDKILTRLNKSLKTTLHFRELKHAQKVVVCQEISNFTISTCLVFSNKSTILGTKWESVFKQPGYLYNYLTRWLLERITAHCTTHNDCRLKLVFSRRAGTNYESMAEYLYKIRYGNEVYPPARYIKWSVFDPKDIVVENHSKWAGLQISDAFTSAFFSAVEPNLYGNYETRYAEIMKTCVVRAHGSALNVGLTPVPSLNAAQCDEQQTNFFRGFVG